MTEHTFDLENGSKFTIRKDPRYGSWTAHFDRGSVPAKLQGKWQSFNELYEKARIYLETRRNPTEIVDGKKRRNSSGKQPDAGFDNRSDGTELS